MNPPKHEGRPGGDGPRRCRESRSDFYPSGRFDRHRAGSHTHDDRHCLDPAAHWAYDHSDLDERWSIETKFYRFTYSLDANHYQPMCRTCHRRADRLAKSARNSSRNQLQLKLIQNTSQ